MSRVGNVDSAFRLQAGDFRAEDLMISLINQLVRESVFDSTASFVIPSMEKRPFSLDSVRGADIHALCYVFLHVVAALPSSTRIYCFHRRAIRGGNRIRKDRRSTRHFIASPLLHIGPLFRLQFLPSPCSSQALVVMART